MIKSILFVFMLLLSGCSTMGLSSDAVGVVTQEYGQCIANTADAPKFGHKRVTFRCKDGRVLLGTVYEKEGNSYIDSGILYKKNGKYRLKQKRALTFKKGLHSVCQLKPMQSQGKKQIKRFYFDVDRKVCRPFIWHGTGGFVPFKNRDACEQYCNYKYQG